MRTLIGSTLLFAALFSAAAQADDDGLTLQQQRDRIGDEMVQERTGAPPASESGVGQSTDTQQQQLEQQAPRSTLNSPARQDNNGQQPGNQKPQGQGIRTQDGSGPNVGPSGSSTAPVTPGTGGGSDGTGGAATGN